MSATAVQLPRGGDVVDLLDSDDEREPQAATRTVASTGNVRRACSGEPRQQAQATRPGPTAGASRPAAPAAPAPAAPGTSPAADEEDVVDLTASPDIEIVSSTVAPVPRQRGVKRPRYSPHKTMALLAMQQQQQQAKAAAPPPEPEPPGPKCGICLDPMGGSSKKTMWAGNCGHVYCKECLTEAVRVTKKCPTCRKGMQLRQLHQVFLDF